MTRLRVALLLAAAGAAMAAPARAASDIAPLQVKAQAGDAEAQFQMGEAYRVGKGVSADQDAAIMWYRRATAQGHIRASEELGFALFAHGDRHEAMPYIEKAAARGEARAFYLLGTAHFNGDYATRDWPLAYAQTERAAAAGLPAAQKNLEVMDHYLLPADKAKAEQLLATLPVVRSALPDRPIAPPARPSAPVQAASVAPKPGKSGKATKAIPAPAEAADAGDKPSKSADANDKPAGAKGSGNWKVQLGAFGSENRARDRWKTLKAKVAGLGTYQQHVLSAGNVQRLQAAGIASKADAQALCKKVVAAGGDCLVIAP